MKEEERTEMFIEKPVEMDSLVSILKELNVVEKRNGRKD